jgi:hypothetical protein
MGREERRFLVPWDRQDKLFVTKNAIICCRLLGPELNVHILTPLGNRFTLQTRWQASASSEIIAAHSNSIGGVMLVAEDHTRLFVPVRIDPANIELERLSLFPRPDAFCNSRRIALGGVLEMTVKAVPVEEMLGIKASGDGTATTDFCLEVNVHRVNDLYGPYSASDMLMIWILRFLRTYIRPSSPFLPVVCVKNFDMHNSDVPRLANFVPRQALRSHGQGDVFWVFDLLCGDLQKDLLRVRWFGHDTGELAWIANDESIIDEVNSFLDSTSILPPQKDPRVDYNAWLSSDSPGAVSADALDETLSAYFCGAGNRFVLDDSDFYPFGYWTDYFLFDFAMGSALWGRVGRQYIDFQESAGRGRHISALTREKKNDAAFRQYLAVLKNAIN